MESAWRMLNEDDGTLEQILTRVRKQEEAKVNILERDRVESIANLAKKNMIDMLELDRVEHSILDEMLEQAGVAADPGTNDWERDANNEMDRLIEICKEEEVEMVKEHCSVKAIPTSSHK